MKDHPIKVMTTTEAKIEKLNQALKEAKDNIKSLEKIIVKQKKKIDYLENNYTLKEAKKREAAEKKYSSVVNLLAIKQEGSGAGIDIGRTNEAGGHSSSQSLQNKRNSSFMSSSISPPLKARKIDMLEANNQLAVKYGGMMDKKRCSGAVFTPAMDKLLLDAVPDDESAKKSWKVIAEKVGHGMTPAQCCKRFNRLTTNCESNRRKWTKQEEDDLDAYVEKCKSDTEKSDGKVDWNVISDFLQRTKADCIKKYENKKASERQRSMKHDPYTAEEDAHIAQKFFEFNSRPQGITGLWSLLSRELNRPFCSVRNRWFFNLSKKMPIPGSGVVHIEQGLTGDVGIGMMAQAPEGRSAAIMLQQSETSSSSSAYRPASSSSSTEAFSGSGMQLNYYDSFL